MKGYYNDITAWIEAEFLYEYELNGEKRVVLRIPGLSTKHSEYQVDTSEVNFIPA